MLSSLMRREGCFVLVNIYVYVIASLHHLFLIYSHNLIKAILKSMFSESLLSGGVGHSSVYDVDTWFWARSIIMFINMLLLTYAYVRSNSRQCL